MEGLLVELLKLRRSVRKFNGNEISRDLLLKLIEAGSQAPSGRDQRLERYFVITKKSSLTKCIDLFDGNAPFLKDAGALILVMYEPDETKMLDMISCDLGAVTQNILLAATSLKIGSCWLGLFNREARCEKIKKAFNIDKKYILYSGVALGWPQDERPFYDKKKSFLEKIIWEQNKDA